MNAPLHPEMELTPDTDLSSASYFSLKKLLIGIACLSFFPLAYLIGHTLVQALS